MNSKNNKRKKFKRKPLGKVFIRKKTMTYKDYKNTPEGERYEVLDGQVIRAMASPKTSHQDVSIELSVDFGAYLRGKKCRAYAASTDVFLFEDTRKKWDDEEVQNWVIPDFFVVCDPTKIVNKGIIGAPDLVVEITSKSTSENDYKKKFNSYERAGVKEYWVIDPVNKKVDVFLLKDGAYQPAKYYFRDHSIKVSVLDDLTIDLKNIFPEREEDE